MHLGHRFSVDLDFFSPAADAVGPDERAVMQAAFADPSLVITHDKDMTFVATWQGVGVSFLQFALYPLVQEPLLLEGVPVATVEEIGAMKLAAIMARGTRKDYGTPSLGGRPPAPGRPLVAIGSLPAACASAMSQQLPLLFPPIAKRALRGACGLSSPGSRWGWSSCWLSLAWARGSDLRR